MGLTGEPGLWKTDVLSISGARILQHISSGILKSLYNMDTEQVRNAVTDKLPWLVHPLESQSCHAGDSDDGQVNEFVELLLRRIFIVRVDRMYKKPKPGKKRLAKWPKKLVPVRDRSLQVQTIMF